MATEKTGMTTWQPIDTAPRDGTLIALANSEMCHSGRWEKMMYGGEWWMSGKYVAAFSTIKPPTHWAPLPEPPK